MRIRKARQNDIKQLAKIYLDCFHGMNDFKKVKLWFVCNLKAYPRMQYFVADVNGKTVGYVLWMEKGGFRQESVWELEQICVLSAFRGKGIGTKLIEGSLKEIKKYLKKRGAKLKLVEVTTGRGNKAQRLYKRSLGAEIACIIKDLFRGDEVILISRFK